jgi:type II secretory pathway pseudopilin PulG
VRTTSRTLAAAHAPRSAYTLLETTIAVVVAALLAAATASSILIASRGLGATAGAGEHTSAAAALAVLTSELRHATSVAKTATGLALTVPDQTGDGSPDAVAYAWSASPGQPMTRSVNGGPASVAIDRIDQIAFEHWAKVDPPESPTATPFVASQHTNGTSTSNEGVGGLSLQGQYFVPNAPSGAQHWTPTKTRVRLRKFSGATGTVAVEIQTVNALGYPTGTILAGGTLNVASMSTSYEWLEVNYANGPSLPPTQPFCIVVKRTSGSGTVQVQSDSSAGAKDMLTSSLGGITWARLSSKALRHEVHGTYLPAQPTQGVVRLHWLGVSVARSAEPHSRLTASADLLNRPPATGFP